MALEWRVMLTCAVLVFAVSLFVPVVVLSAALNAVYQLSDAAVKLLAPPGPPQQMLRHVVEQYVSPLALRDLNATTWTMLGFFMLLVVAVSTIDATLKRWNEQLAELAMVSPDVVQHYSGTSYDKALLANATASAVRRAH